MKPKVWIKSILDAAMILLLPVLMAEILTGQQAHEWLGTAMMLSFVLHHLLNLGWMQTKRSAPARNWERFLYFEKEFFEKDLMKKYSNVFCGFI